MPLFVIEPDTSIDDAPQPEPQGAQPLGHAAGVRWYKDDAIPAEGRAPTDGEMATALLELPAIRSLKASARRKIEAEVGDVYELIADQSKQIEALTALVCRMAAEQLGGTAMDEVTKGAYLARVEMVVGALDSGQLVLRGDQEGPDNMLARVLARTSRINQIVAAEYLPRRQAFLGN